MATQSQHVITVSPTGFTQTLAQVGGIQNWSFPIIYEVSLGSQPAALAQINIGGNITKLIFGQPSQTITGSGQFVDLAVDLGPNCAGVKIGANPYNQSGCNTKYPFLTSFIPQQIELFQFACVAHITNWNLDVDLEFQNDPENPPPTSANVSLLVNGQTYKQIPQGHSNYTPSGATLAFAIMNFKGTGLKLVYTLS